MPLQASTLSLLAPSLSSSTNLKPISLLFDPTSQSLALTLNDSSILLFPSFSLLSPPPPLPPLSIPPISTSCCFLSLTPNPNLNPNSSHTLFVSTSPSASSSSTVLRAWIRRSSLKLFTNVGIKFKDRIGNLKNGIVLDIKHGFGVRVAGSVNVMVVHSVAESAIWVLGVRMGGDERMELVKCAVIECMLPIYDVRVSMGVLVLGEVNGVRIFPLRAMVKGGLGKKRTKKREGNGLGDGAARGKLRTLKLKQDSGDLGSFFVMMRCAVVQDSDSNIGVPQALKAVSIRSLSQKKFLILDSVGDLYLLSLQNGILASEATAHSSIGSISGRISHLDATMKVQLLAVLPDLSAKMQVLWLSDGAHTVHVTSLTNTEHPIRESDENGKSGKEMLISAIQVIFTSEKVQDIVPLSANAILILGQGNIFSYSIV